jgi:hypothetical protein
MKKWIMLGLTAVGCMGLVGGAMAQTDTMLDFTSFLYEDGPNPFYPEFHSATGEVMTCVGYIESVGPELDWNTAEVELTLVLDGLVSQGELEYPGDLVYIIYDGGWLDIYGQRYDDPLYTSPDYGIDPPNGTSPATFTDGDLYLHGEFISFYMIYYPVLHVGNFEGHLLWTGGSQLNSLFMDAAGYTLAGTVDPFGAPVPLGYDLEADGHVSFDAAIRTEESTWGRVKNLYR